MVAGASIISERRLNLLEGSLEWVVGKTLFLKRKKHRRLGGGQGRIPNTGLGNAIEGFR